MMSFRSPMMAALIQATQLGAYLGRSRGGRLLEVIGFRQSGSWRLTLLLLGRPRLLVQLPQQLHPLRAETRII